MPTPSSTTTAPPAGGSSGSGGEDTRMSDSTGGSSVRFVPAFCLGVVAAVVFQLAWGGLTLTSFFLKLFIYVSFAFLCFLAGSFVLLVRKSPLKVSCFSRTRRQPAARLDFFQKLMVGSWSSNTSQNKKHPHKTEAENPILTFKYCSH